MAKADPHPTLARAHQNSSIYGGNIEPLLRLVSVKHEKILATENFVAKLIL